ncbi:dienelactone hydrolase family protein [Methylocapsa sp. S129]|uniref:dienelactone hydrolase family protein n=1 Tax=Methylocapsa sp. S129 TaxID=1641869 RepID=UPI00131B6DA9|nr:dienelactone hydrolase family protein [Methylocapsa sp. S129]
MRTSVCRCLIVAALSGLAFAHPSLARAEELVKFNSAAARPDQGEEPVARDSAEIHAHKRGAPIQGYLSRPNGAGPFPAIVLLHSCLGLPANRRAIADMFAGWGYVALFVDDFTIRGIRDTCATDFGEGIADAFGALAFLSRRPDVDPKRIAAVGYSQGADTALQIASARFAAAFAIPRDLNFKVAAAFYPPCANQADVRMKIPTLILIGGSDQVTPAGDCERLARNQPDLGLDFKLVVYPGAHHLFDDPGLVAGKRLLGMWLQYDADADERSKSEMRDFLGARLAR